MGLGPPVCTKCMIILSFNQNWKEDGYSWYCKTCGPDSYGNQSSSHLWCFNDSDQSLIEKRTQISRILEENDDDGDE